MDVLGKVMFHSSQYKRIEEDYSLPEQLRDDVSHDLRKCATFILEDASGSKVGNSVKRGEGGGGLLQCGEEGVEKVRVWSSVRGNVEGAFPIALL